MYLQNVTDSLSGSVTDVRKKIVKCNTGVFRKKFSHFPEQLASFFTACSAESLLDSVALQSNCFLLLLLPIML